MAQLSLVDAHIIFGVIISVNDNTCAPSIDALRTTHGDNTMTTILDTVVLFISQLGEVKRSTDLLAFMELTFGII